MKKMIISIVLVLAGFLAHSQDIQAEITTAIQKGDSKLLAKHFYSNIELTIVSTDGVYSKAQAEVLLKDFFTKNPVSSYNVNHVGGKDEAKYIIGTLVAKQKKYRVSILVKLIEKQKYIHQLRIENE